MASVLADKDACGPQGAVRYQRHRPEQTPLYQLVEQHYPRFLAELETKGHALPRLPGRRCRTSVSR